MNSSVQEYATPNMFQQPKHPKWAKLGTLLKTPERKPKIKLSCCSKDSKEKSK